MKEFTKIKPIQFDPIYVFKDVCKLMDEQK